MAIKNSYFAVYLSPHYDDASLSCGGAIHQHTQGGQTAWVITICAAPPPPGQPLSPFAAAMHQKWGNPADVVATRQAEDQASMAVLGADYHRLSFKDCIYRGLPEQEQWFYNNDAELFGSVHPDDERLSQHIAAAVLELLPHQAETVVYAPLGVGHHVDHQLVHAAAWILRRQGWTIAFYEDYPYVDPHAGFAPDLQAKYALTPTLSAQKAAPLQPDLRFLSEENLQAKIDSVRAYRSQLKMLFDDEANVGPRLRQYARYVGEGQLAERVWRPE